MRRSAAPSQLQAAKRPRFMTPLLKPPVVNQSQNNVNALGNNFRNGASESTPNKAPAVSFQKGLKTSMPRPNVSASVSLSKPDCSPTVSFSKPDIYDGASLPLTGFRAGASLPKPDGIDGASLSKSDCSATKPNFSSNDSLPKLDFNADGLLPKPNFSAVASLTKADCRTGASLSKPDCSGPASLLPTGSDPVSLSIPTGRAPASLSMPPGRAPASLLMPTGRVPASLPMPDCSAPASSSMPICSTPASLSVPPGKASASFSVPTCRAPASLSMPHCSGPASLSMPYCSAPASLSMPPGRAPASFLMPIGRAPASLSMPDSSASASLSMPDCKAPASLSMATCSAPASLSMPNCSAPASLPKPDCNASSQRTKSDCRVSDSRPKLDCTASASLPEPDFNSVTTLSESDFSARASLPKPDFSVEGSDFWENSQSQSDSSQRDPDLSQKPESLDNQTQQENINSTGLLRSSSHAETSGPNSNVDFNGKEDTSGTTDQVIKESRQTRSRAARHKAFKAPTLRGPPSKLPNSTSTVTPASEIGTQNAEPSENYFSVMWCKASKKKHKKWEGDAVLVTTGRSVSLIDMDGKEIGKGGGYKISELQTLSEGQTLRIQGKEIEVMGILGEEDFKSGRCFQAAGVRSSPSTVTPAPSGGGTKPFVNPQGSGKKRKATGTKAGASNRPVGPRFDPEAPDALVMPRPTQAHQWEYNKNNLAVVDVVVDPHLALHLRPHQRDGVIFLYKCIMGMKPYLGRGAILADEMGLGKTLQCISLIWTLYKQGPYGGAPVLKRILIITPGSLVKNWSREFKKWLGNERLSVFAVCPDNKAEEFIKCTIYPVMIISYEMFIRNIDVIKQVRFDLVVCDEGHRLKNTNIKTTSYVNSLNIQKRILLTGTPVQNDLQELYSLVELCNPGILGSLSAFRHVYEDPILASRQPNSDEAAKLLGESRAGELNRLTSLFILRRTQDINNKYLPPKVDMVLFCKPSSLQVRLYQQFIRSRMVLSYLSSSDSAKHLMCIAALKKLCNHPTLIYKQSAEASGENVFEDQLGLYQAVTPLFPECYDPAVPETGESGKLQVLAGFLSSLSQTQERIVLVSNYTQTLNVLEHLCVTNNYQYLRLDGQTPTAKRQQLVERFNSKYSKDFVFLLSSKAGGVGLNLIGASRLVLYDIDWNPANDLQAMARVWRDGQKRRVHIYRLVTTGTLEEKIYQRQITKQGLSGTVVDAKTNAKLSFSPEDLRDLFKLDEDTLCSTHDLLKCPCNQTPGWPPAAVTDASLSRPCQLLADKTNNTQRNMCMSELLEWQHVPGPKPDLSHVDPLLTEHTDNITYVFWCESNTAAPQS